tara:strand:- start:96 stop:734 length:639 start_codon:yes stop_codon:yes gene_type:complete
MTNKLEEYLELQIKNGNINWDSKSKLIRSSGEKVNGNTNKIVKKFENKFNFSIDLKNKEIKKYFDKLPKNSFVNVLKARDEINKNLSSNNQIGGERSCKIIYDRLNDPKFNTNGLKPQSLKRESSHKYPSAVSKQIEMKIKKLNEKLKIDKKFAFVYLENTQAGNQTLRFHSYNTEYSQDKERDIFAKTNKSTSFYPNNESLEKIKKIIYKN